MADGNTAAVAARRVRFDELIPCTAAFIDAKTPGSHLKENFTIVGPGVAENPRQYVHIRAPHGFNIGAARQPPGIVNSNHSHETAEVFMVHSGQWRFTWGEHGEDGHVDIDVGDIISIPTQVFRGFLNIGAEPGFLFAVLGGDDPGHVTWAPDVIRKATGHGLILLTDGRLIDTTEGDVIPADGVVEQPLDAAALKRFKRITADAMGLARGGSGPAVALLPGYPPVRRAIGTREASIAWPHGFELFVVEAGPCTSAPFSLPVPTVAIVHSGSWRWQSDRGSVDLGPGDTFSIPEGVTATLEQSASSGTLWLVTSGDDLLAQV
jgi:mannose-6-phosphate isomerase-like protein (cupin superfamily)